MQNKFIKFIQKRLNPVLMILYGPWCCFYIKNKPSYGREYGNNFASDFDDSLLKSFVYKKYDFFPTEKEKITKVKQKYFESDVQPENAFLRKMDYTVEKHNFFLKNELKVPNYKQGIPLNLRIIKQETDWFAMEPSVVTLNINNIKKTLKSSKHALVFFYKTNNRKSAEIKSDFLEAATYFKGDENVLFGVANCDDNNIVCNNYEVKKFPTFIYFNYYFKNVKLYEGDTKAKDFITFMKDPYKMLPNMKSANKEWLLDYPVLNLNEDNFIEKIKKGIVIVLFYATWCPHCREFKPSYVKAAKNLNEKGVTVKFAAIDSTRNPTVLEKYNIESFPTIKVFKNGKYISEYNGLCNERELIDFVENLL